jgi:hypothetical protein
MRSIIDVFQVSHGLLDRIGRLFAATDRSGMGLGL